MKYFSFIYFLLSSFYSLGSELPFVKSPFDSAKRILCDQGNESPAGHSHTYANTLFALDLASSQKESPAIIYAGVNGEVISYDKCTEHNNKCGAGFGNHLKILANDGTLVFYAHLDKVFIESGEYVKAGEPIGTEGNTGLTGKDNRHLHFSVHSNWKKEGVDYYNKYLGSLPTSVPFKMNLCQEKYSTCTGQAIDVRKLRCKRITGEVEWVSTFNI